MDLVGDLPESREAHAPEVAVFGGVAVGGDGNTVDGMSLSETPPVSWTTGAADGFAVEGAAEGAGEGPLAREEGIAAFLGEEPAVAALNMTVLDDAI